MSAAQKNSRRTKREARTTGRASSTTETTELTESEILEMQDSISSEWGEGAPRKAKAFWPSALRLAGTFRTHELGLSVVLAFGIVSTVLTVWAPSILGDAMDVIFDGFLGDGVEFGALGQIGRAHV